MQRRRLVLATLACGVLVGAGAVPAAAAPAPVPEISFGFMSGDTVEQTVQAINDRYGPDQTADLFDRLAESPTGTFPGIDEDADLTAVADAVREDAHLPQDVADLEVAPAPVAKAVGPGEVSVMSLATATQLGGPISQG